MRHCPALILACLCLLCLSASRCANPLAAPSRGSVSILAYNVKSLFDAVDDGPEFPEFSVARGLWDDARYRIRLANVAAAVLGSAPQGGRLPGPDILCLEEIENGAVLEALRGGPLAQARYGYAAIAPAEGGPFSVCVLSRLPILSASCHAAAGAAGRVGRDLLELELQATQQKLFLVCCHWKSKVGGAEASEEPRREEAALVRGRVEALLAAEPGAAIVVCGDFNESPDEYLRVGRLYRTALMPVEEAGEGRSALRLLIASSPAQAKPLAGEAVLFSPWEEAGGYSYSFHGERERLDGFLLSPGLLDGEGLRYSGFASSTAAFLLDAEGEPLAWPGSHTGAGGSGYSDHLPVLLELRDGQ